MRSSSVGARPMTRRFSDELFLSVRHDDESSEILDAAEKVPMPLIVRASDLLCFGGGRWWGIAAPFLALGFGTVRNVMLRDLNDLFVMMWSLETSINLWFGFTCICRGHFAEDVVNIRLTATRRHQT